MSTAKKLERFHGQMVNWYDTRTLAPLTPLVISSVDNGNLVCSLWVLKQGCLKAQQEPIFSTAIYQSVVDHLALSIEAMKKGGCSDEAIASAEIARLEWCRLGSDVLLWAQAAPKLSAQIDEILAKQETEGSDESKWWLGECQEKARDLVSLAELFAPWLLLRLSGAREVWPQLFDTSVLSKLTLENYSGILANICKKAETVAGVGSVADLDRCMEDVEQLRIRLQALAHEADELVNDMDFGLFYSEAHKALSVGYDVAQERIQPSFYDLLASEARSAVFVGIAKNDIPQEAWFSMGRTHTRYAKHNVLLSWTGTMFEYLMPALWISIFPRHFWKTAW